MVRNRDLVSIASEGLYRYPTDCTAQGSAVSSVHENNVESIMLHVWCLLMGFGARQESSSNRLDMPSLRPERAAPHVQTMIRNLLEPEGVSRNVRWRDYKNAHSSSSSNLLTAFPLPMHIPAHAFTTIVRFDATHIGCPCRGLPFLRAAVQH